MKVYLVKATFPDGGVEGVVFTNKDDANDALRGCEEGSSLAVAWSDLYMSNDEDEIIISMDEIEI